MPEHTEGFAYQYTHADKVERKLSHLAGVTLISKMIKKALINRNDSRSVLLQLCSSRTNGSRCAAVAGQCVVRINRDRSFSEAAELSRATAAERGVSHLRRRNKNTRDATRPGIKGFLMFNRAPASPSECLRV